MAESDTTRRVRKWVFYGQDAYYDADPGQAETRKDVYRTEIPEGDLNFREVFRQAREALLYMITFKWLKK